MPSAKHGHFTASSPVEQLMKANGVVDSGTAKASRRGLTALTMREIGRTTVPTVKEDSPISTEMFTKASGRRVDDMVEEHLLFQCHLQVNMASLLYALCECSILRPSQAHPALWLCLISCFFPMMTAHLDHPRLLLRVVCVVQGLIREAGLGPMISSCRSSHV